MRYIFFINSWIISLIILSVDRSFWNRCYFAYVRILIFISTSIINIIIGWYWFIYIKICNNFFAWFIYIPSVYWRFCIRINYSVCISSIFYIFSILIVIFLIYFFNSYCICFWWNFIFIPLNIFINVIYFIC